MVTVLYILLFALFCKYSYIFATSLSELRFFSSFNILGIGRSIYRRILFPSRNRLENFIVSNFRFPIRYLTASITNISSNEMKVTFH
jgi:hypothetical protein